MRQEREMYVRSTLSGLSFAAAMHASVAAVAQVDDRASRAAKLQVSGFQALKQKRYDAALRNFEQAYELDHHALLLGMISRAQFELGNCGAAVESARKFVGEGAPGDLPSAKALLEQVLDECSEVSIESVPDGAQLRIDGQPAEPNDPTPWRGWLKAGEHTVVVRSRSLEESQVLRVPAGEHPPIRLSIDLTHPPAARGEAPPAQSPAVAAAPAQPRATPTPERGEPAPPPSAVSEPPPPMIVVVERAPSPTPAPAQAQPKESTGPVVQSQPAPAQPAPATSVREEAPPAPAQAAPASAIAQAPEVSTTPSHSISRGWWVAGGVAVAAAIAVGVVVATSSAKSVPEPTFHVGP
jgi:hypothetical protein